MSQIQPVMHLLQALASSLGASAFDPPGIGGVLEDALEALEPQAREAFGPIDSHMTQCVLSHARTMERRVKRALEEQLAGLMAAQWRPDDVQVASLTEQHQALSHLLAR
jgi:hypothetical protein